MASIFGALARPSIRSTTRFRFTSTSVGTSETLNFTAKYAQYLKGGDVGSADEIPPGTGAIVRQGKKKLAVFREENGTLSVRSAVCTHLGCILGWNSAEKTWDCPCHGSRYDAHGRVIDGPANTDLQPAKLDAGHTRGKRPSRRSTGGKPRPVRSSRH